MIPFIITVLYIGGTLLLGIWMSKNNKDMRAFATANGSVGLLATACMLYTASVGPSFSVGAVQTVWNVGISGLGLMAGQILGYVLFALPQVRLWKKLGSAGVMSVSEQFEYLYGKKMGKFFSVIILFLGYSSCAIGPSTMAAIIAPMLGLNRTVVVLVLIAVLAVIVALGGIKGASATSLLHALFLFLGTGLTAVLVLCKFGGIGNLTAQIPAQTLTLCPNGVWVFVVSMLPTCLSQATSAYNVGGIIAAKDVKTGKRSIVLTVALLAYNLFMLAVIGFGAIQMLPADSDSTSAIYLVANSFGPIAGSLMSVGIIAAIYSSLIPFHVTSATIMTRSILMPLSPRLANDEALQLRTAKIVSILTCVVISLLGTYVTSLISYMAKVTAFSAPVAIAWVAGLLWHRVGEKSMLWSTIAGSVVSLLLTLVPSISPLGQPAIVWGSLVTLLVLIPVTLCSKERVSAGWKKYEALDEVQ